MGLLLPHREDLFRPLVRGQDVLGSKGPPHRKDGQAMWGGGWGWAYTAYHLGWLFPLPELGDQEGTQDG